MNLKSDNARWFTPADTLLSTVKLAGCQDAWETCLFTPDGSHVIQQYNNPYDARHGHMGHTAKLGLRFIE